MAINCTKSKNFSKLDILRTLNLPFSIDQYSTLNEKFNIGNVNPPANEYPVLGYLAIGRGGHTNIVGSGNNTLIELLQHSPTDAALFEHIPFQLVPTTNDLSVAERANYRIRLLLTINGIDYFAYYLKVITQSTISVDTQIIQIQNGQISSDTVYTPSATSLTPTPVNISNTNVNVVNGNHLVTQAILPITLNADDIASIVNACTIIYGSVSYATISEIGIVGGFDVNTTSNIGNVAASYTEIQTAQIMAFISVLHELQQQPTSITFQYAVSSSSPLPAS